MTKFKESVSEDTQRQTLMDVLNRIKERGQERFKNPLKVQCYEPDEILIPGDHSVFYIVEVRKADTRWLDIIPREQYRTLFVIDSSFIDAGCNKKEVNCSVFDRSLLDIVKEEVQKYADAFQVTAVNLAQNYFAR